MMMPPQPSGPYSVSRPAWQCGGCLAWNDLADMTCSKCGAIRQKNSRVDFITISVGTPTPLMPSGNRLSSDRTFKVAVVIGIVLILLILVTGLLHVSFPPPPPASSADSQTAAP